MAPRTARSTRAAAPAKKAPTRRPVAPAAPAKKTAPPAKKAVSAGVTKKPPVKPTVEAAEKPRPATKPKLQAHDVLRAHLDMVKAQQTFQELHKAYWEEYGEAVDFTVDHTKAVMELDAPKQSGPKRKDGPVRKAMVEEEDSVIGEVFDREKLEYQTSLPELRQLFKELVEKDERLTPTLKKLDILKQLEENGYFREEVAADSDEADDEEEEDLGAEDEFEDESDVEDEDDDGDGDSEDDEEDDDAEEEDEGFLTAEDLDEMSLAELREVAEENQVVTKGKKEADLRKELKALLSEEDEEEPDDEEEDEDDDEDDDGYLTVEDLENMDLEELQALIKDTGDTPPAAVKKNAAKLRKWLAPYLEEDDEDEDE